MLGISAAAQFMSGPGQSYSVAAFKEPMRATLDVSETGYSLAYGLATVISGLSLPFTGQFLDRFGARRMLPIVGASLAVACTTMSQAHTLTALALGFTLIRCTGQGALTLIGAWIVGEWFLRRRGLATAIAGLGSSLSVMAFPMLNGWLIDSFGWRNTWLALATIVAVTMVVPVWLILRDRPEELGLLPDGDTTPPVPNSSLASEIISDPEDSWSVSEALRDATFWKLLSVPLCSGLVGTGMIFHQVSILSQRGVSSQAALGLISVQAAIATVAALGAGWLTDRIKTERLLAVAMVLLCLSVLVILFMERPVLAFAYAALMGLHGSILRSAGTVVWVNYYGRKHQGSVRGISMSMMILAAAFGPLPLAVAQDQLGDITSALVLFAILPVIAGLLVLTASRPQRS